MITHAQTMAKITEAVFTNYAGQELATATWGALAEHSTNLGRKTTYPQLTFPTVGSTGDTINGFFIADVAGTSGDKCIGQANFDDGEAVDLNENDMIKVTPTIALLH